jgi:hypothetical protein
MDGGWHYNETTGRWCIDFPAAPMNASLVWSTEIKDAYVAFLSFQTQYSFGTYSCGYVELSANGGERWYILDKITDTGGPEKHEFDISSWGGSDLLIRFRAWGGEGTHVSAGQWCIWDLKITGMKDTHPPVSVITMQGTLEENDWYSTPVHIVILATDQGVGLESISFILDGEEHHMNDDSVTFSIHTDGVHSLEYFSKDKAQNEENHHFCTIKIDTTPPNLTIHEPTPGLYILGNKILSLKQITIIGSFQIEAEATDPEDGAGLYRVQYYLNDALFAENTEQPFHITCQEHNFGQATIKIIAEDMVHHTTMQTKTITYFHL